MSSDTVGWVVCWEHKPTGHTLSGATSRNKLNWDKVSIQGCSTEGQTVIKLSQIYKIGWVLCH